MAPTLSAGPALVGAIVPEHLGGLHPVEQALTLALAFGPFLVLGVVLALRRRQDAAQEGEHREDPDGAAQSRGSPR